MYSLGLKQFAQELKQLVLFCTRNMIPTSLSSTIFDVLKFGLALLSMGRLINLAPIGHASCIT